MHRALFAMAAIAALGLGVTAFAEQPSKGTPAGNVAAGKQLFHQRCSSCHGINADGLGTSEDGSYLPPARVRPADLTTLSQRNGGTFPASRVSDAIYMKGVVKAHGTPEMPAWGNVFYDLKSNPKVYEQRQRDITAYIESVQVKGK